MIGDEAAQEVLRRVVADWESNGPLGVLRSITRDVWLTDVIRHEPDLGDDALCLGITASRNICNRAVKQLRDVPGVVARDLRTLEITYGDRVLHVGKAPSACLDWDVSRVNWTSSDIRDDAARANSELYQPLNGTLFEDYGPIAGQHIDADRLTHLHYLWIGTDEGTTREWIGFPRLEEPFWFAALPLDDEQGWSGDGSADEPLGPTSPVRPSFDQLTEPEIPMTRRRTAARSQEERGA